MNSLLKPSPETSPRAPACGREIKALKTKVARAGLSLEHSTAYLRPELFTLFLRNSHCP